MTTEEQNKKILVVEDDEDFLSIMKMKFENEGFAVVLAKDGEEGLAAAGKENPDIILSDVLIPKMDGIEMAKKIRETGNGVLILFLTNIKDDTYIKNMKDLGNTDYLIKADVGISEIVDKTREKLSI